MKELYTRMNQHITPSPGLVNQTVHTTAEDAPAPRQHVRLKWIPLLALCLAVMVAMPALAANNEAFNSLLYRIVPDVALYFRPVNLVSEDNGITMTVLAVDVNGPAAELYIAVSGEGVDKTIDLYDSYSLDRPSDTSAGCTLAAYDAQTNTAVFHIHYRLLDGSNIASTSKVTFSVSQMLRNKVEQTLPVIVGAELPSGNAVTTQAETGHPAYVIYGRSGTECWRSDDTVMVVGQANYPITDGLTITAAGMVNGKYRVQIHEQNKLATDNHAFLYLKDASGQVVQPEGSIGFGYRDENGVRQDYDESIFSILPEQLVNYTLWADTVTASPALQGDWSVTIPLVEYEQNARPI